MDLKCYFIDFSKDVGSKAYYQKREMNRVYYYLYESILKGNANRDEADNLLRNNKLVIFRHFISQAQYNDILLLKRCASQIGLKIKDPIVTEDEELHLKLYHKKEWICYIAKKWDDSRFLLGEMIGIDVVNADELLENAYNIFAKYHVNVHMKLGERGHSITFEIYMPKDGFSATLLNDTVKSLQRFREEIKSVSIID